MVIINDIKKNNIMKKNKILKKIILFLIIFFTFSFSNNCFAKSTISINASDNITDEQIQTVIRAINATSSYMLINFNRKLNIDVKMNLGTNAGDLPNLYTTNETNLNIGGKSYLGEINLLIDSNSTDYYITFLTAHELIHQYQGSSISNMQIIKKNMWFTEGMADVLAVNIASQINPEMASKFRTNVAANIIAYPCLLSEITTKDGWSTAFNKQEKTYAKADAALLYLIDNYDINLIFTYYSNLLFYTPSKALEITYGLTIKDLEDIIMSY